MDDCPRMMWLNLLKKRSNAPRTIKLFYKEIMKNQFSTSICTDNTMEYIKGDIFLFCANNGINHQTFHSYISQQMVLLKGNIDIFYINYSYAYSKIYAA